MVQSGDAAMNGTQIVDSRLIELERTIERGLQTFVEVGTALMEIRDSRLYRDSHTTFEDYCRERWGFSRSRAHRLIEAAEVTSDLLPTGNILPTSERQVRPLASLPAEDRATVWQAAVETAPNGKVTAAHVERTVNEYRTPVADALPAWVEDDDDEGDWTDDEPDDEPVTVIDQWGHEETVHVPTTPSPSMAIHFSSESPEHYTPQSVIAAAIACMGAIDLDPCSNSHDAPNVPAARHYTVTDDGLNQSWGGRVYMNPPYGREIGAWVEKLELEHRNGEVTAAIALVPARTDTQWFRRLRDYPVCFVTGRLTFVGNSDPAPFPSAIFYLGDDIGAFYDAFSGMGDIWQRIEPGMFAE